MNKFYYDFYTGSYYCNILKRSCLVIIVIKTYWWTLCYYDFFNLEVKWLKLLIFLNNQTSWLIFKVQKLLSFCPAVPANPTGNFSIDHRGSDAILCLSYYLLKSKQQHIDHIFPYLTDILKMSFGSIKWHLKVYHLCFCYSMWFCGNFEYRISTRQCLHQNIMITCFCLEVGNLRQEAGCSEILWIRKHMFLERNFPNYVFINCILYSFWAYVYPRDMFFNYIFQWSIKFLNCVFYRAYSIYLFFCWFL